MSNAITVKPTFENIAETRDFVQGKFEDLNVQKSLQIKLFIALDEILSNIVKFSGATFAAVECDIKENIVYLKFTDDGICFNPLESAEVDTAAPLEEREIGGLGIFMVKNSMDYMDYEYADNKNVLTLGLKF